MIHVLISERLLIHQAFVSTPSLSAGTERAWLGVVLPPLYVNLAKHVILRKLVGGETEIGSFIEVVVAWRIIYRISGK